MIRTGQEKKEDFDDFLSELDEILDIRDQQGANTGIQLTFTPLVFYSGTPLRWMPRITAKESFYNEKNMGYFLDGVRALVEKHPGSSVRTKFNGRGPGTYIEQLILDLGFAGTSFLVDVCLNQGVIYERHFGDKDKEGVLKSLAKYNIDPEFLFPERPLDYIFSVDVLEINTEAHLKRWAEMHKTQDFYHEICLRTPAHKEGKCFGCGNCHSKEEIERCTKRSLSSESTIEDVFETLSLSKGKSAVRVVVTMKSGCELYSRDTLSHYITSQFLRRDDDLAEAFYQVSKNTCSWISNNGQLGWVGGRWAYDIKWKEPISATRLVPYIEEINSVLETCRIDAVYDSDRKLEASIDDEVLYIGDVENTSMSRVKDKLSNFDWGVKVAVKGMGDLETEVRAMPELKDKCLFVQNGAKLSVAMVLPANVSPYLVMSSIMGKSLSNMYADCLFRVVDFGKKVDAACSCGESLIHSYYSDKVSKRCLVCTAKALLYRMVNRKE